MGSRAAAERLIESGAALVDGARKPKSHRLTRGEKIQVEPEASQVALAEEVMELGIAYEDEHLLVVDKPAGLVVHPGAGREAGTLVHGLLARGIEGGAEPLRPGIVHRLDRDTSGLMVVARSAEAHRRLQQLVRRRALERRYLALVRGRPRSRRGRIEAPIGRDRRDPTKQSLDTDTPREAVTEFEVRELFAEYALLAVRLETGRTHQIRVHLAAIELPVVGDEVYGVRDDLVDRQFLHSASLAFPHPLTGVRVEVASPLPPGLAAAVERLRGEE